MLWLIATSAWSRRAIPAVAEQLSGLVQRGDELALSPPVLLELLRGPRGAEVARLRDRLTSAMRTVAVDATTFRLAASAMERLAMYQPEAHRLPVTDLVTAALAAQHACGVVHCDGDFELIAEPGGLEFAHHPIELPAGDASGHPVAGRQRALKRDLFRLLHQMPVRTAEAFLERVVAEARTTGPDLTP